MSDENKEAMYYIRDNDKRIEKSIKRISELEKSVKEVWALFKVQNKNHNEIKENVKFNNNVLKTHGQLVPKNQEDIETLKKEVNPAYMETLYLETMENRDKKIEKEIAELRENIDLQMKEIHTRSHNQAHKIEEVLRLVISLIIPNHLKKELLEKLDVGSTSATESLDRQTVRCRNLDKVLCPDRECPCEAFEPVQTEKKEDRSVSIRTYKNGILEEATTISKDGIFRKASETEKKEECKHDKWTKCYGEDGSLFALWCQECGTYKASGGEKEFRCGHCGKIFLTYHDGTGFNTGMCPKCFNEWDTVGLDEKPPEHRFYKEKINGEIIKLCIHCGTGKKASGGEKPICPECKEDNGVIPLSNGMWHCGDCNIDIEKDEKPPEPREDNKIYNIITVDEIKEYLEKYLPKYSIVKREDLQFLKELIEDAYNDDWLDKLEKWKRIKEAYGIE